jgi:hypothetical protein
MNGERFRGPRRIAIYPTTSPLAETCRSYFARNGDRVEVLSDEIVSPQATAPLDILLLLPPDCSVSGSLHDDAAHCHAMLLAPMKLLETAAPSIRASGGSAVVVTVIPTPRIAADDPLGAALAAGRQELVRSWVERLAPRARIDGVAIGDGSPSPLGGGGVTEAEIVEGIGFVVGEGARFLTGATLVVDRGASLFWTMGGSGGSAKEGGGSEPAVTAPRDAKD